MPTAPDKDGQSHRILPTIQLENLHGEQVEIPAAGEPQLVFMWASW